MTIYSKSFPTKLQSLDMVMVFLDNRYKDFAEYLDEKVCAIFIVDSYLRLNEYLNQLIKNELVFAAVAYCCGHGYIDSDDQIVMYGRKKNVLVIDLIQKGMNLSKNIHFNSCYTGKCFSKLINKHQDIVKELTRLSGYRNWLRAVNYEKFQSSYINNKCSRRNDCKAVGNFLEYHKFERKKKTAKKYNLRLSSKGQRMLTLYRKRAYKTLRK
jgi:hypothetical protein